MKSLPAGLISHPSELRRARQGELKLDNEGLKALERIVAKRISEGRGRTGRSRVWGSARGHRLLAAFLRGGIQKI